MGHFAAKQNVWNEVDIEELRQLLQGQTQQVHWLLRGGTGFTNVGAGPWLLLFSLPLSAVYIAILFCRCLCKTLRRSMRFVVFWVTFVIRLSEKIVFAVLHWRYFMILDCTVAMDSGTEKCPETDRNYFPECGPLICGGSVQMNSLKTPKSSPAPKITTLIVWEAREIQFVLTCCSYFFGAQIHVGIRNTEFT